MAAGGGVLLNRSYCWRAFYGLPRHLLLNIYAQNGSLITRLTSLVNVRLGVLYVR